MFAKVLAEYFMQSLHYCSVVLLVYHMDEFVVFFQGLGDDEDAEYLPFMKQPFCIYRGHTADLLDVSWSKVCNIRIHGKITLSLYMIQM